MNQNYFNQHLPEDDEYYYEYDMDWDEEEEEEEEVKEIDWGDDRPFG